MKVTETKRELLWLTYFPSSVSPVLNEMFQRVRRSILLQFFYNCSRNKQMNFKLTIPFHIIKHVCCIPRKWFWNFNDMQRMSTWKTRESQSTRQVELDERNQAREGKKHKELSQESLFKQTLFPFHLCWYLALQSKDVYISFLTCEAK